MNIWRKSGGWLWLTGLFFKELTLSVRDVVHAVMHPGRIERSGIVAVPLKVRSDAGIALLANMVTLTPGTTSLHVSEDRRWLYVHVMNLSESTVTQIQEGFERRVLEVLP